MKSTESSNKRRWSLRKLAVRYRSFIKLRFVDDFVSARNEISIRVKITFDGIFNAAFKSMDL